MRNYNTLKASIRVASLTTTVDLVKGEKGEKMCSTNSNRMKNRGFKDIMWKKYVARRERMET